MHENEKKSGKKVEEKRKRDFLTFMILTEMKEFSMQVVFTGDEEIDRIE